jgi:hypothetical protein
MQPRTKLPHIVNSVTWNLRHSTLFQQYHSRPVTFRLASAEIAILRKKQKRRPKAPYLHWNADVA